MGKYNTENRTQEQIRKYKRHGSELIDPEKFMYARKDIISAIIMNCETATAVDFKTKLGFEQHDLIIIIITK